MSIPIIDTHQHLVYADRWPYSWTADIPQLTGRNFHYTDYLEAIDGTGIQSAVFMETTPDDPHWHEETRFVDGMSREADSLIQGIIANCRPEQDGFDAFLDDLSSLRVKGLRRFLHVAPEGTAESPNFISNLRKLSNWALPFDLCVFENQLQLAETIARACPDTQFVLDHCGVPEIDGGDPAKWRESISGLAEADNVVCKISGVLAYCPAGQINTETVRPYVEHCIEVFGWDRVVWGSDWPVVTMTSTLRDWVAASREIVADEDEVHQHKLFHCNAERVYRVNPVTGS